MPLPRRDEFEFLFNGGRGIRTNQLRGNIELNQLANDVRVYQGVWDANTGYLIAQSVQHNNLIWEALVDNTNVEPSLVAGNPWLLKGVPRPPTNAEIDAGTLQERVSWTPESIRRAVRNGSLLSTFDGQGAPTVAPTVHGQVEVNSLGITYVAADEFVNVTSEPTLDSSMVSTIAPNQGTWPFWRGLSTFGFTLTSEGYFIYVYRTRDFNQRQGNQTLSRTWPSLLEYARATPTFIANAPTNLFPATGDTDSVFLGGENHEFRSDAEVAAHIAANQLDNPTTTPYVWIQKDNNPVVQWQLRLAQPGAYNAGVVSITTQLHWVRQALRDDIPEPATDAEIDAGSEEELRLSSPAQIARAAGQAPNKKVLDEVDRIPDTFQGSLIYLTHDYTEGGKLDFTVTAGFHVLDVGGGFTENQAGYDSGRFDGTPFGSANRNMAPVEVIQGGGTATQYGIGLLQSYNQPFMDAVSMVEINGSQYAVGPVQVSGGIYTLVLTDGPTDLTTATFTFNILRKDGTWFGTDGAARIDRAGSYQWDPDATPPRYTEGLFGPFQQVALELPVYAGLLYRVGHRLFAPRTDFVIDAVRLPPDGANVDTNWIEATDVTATVGGTSVVLPGEVELPADWSLNEGATSWQILEEGRIWVTFFEATTAAFRLNGAEGWIVPPNTGERFRLVVARMAEDGANQQVDTILYTSPYRDIGQVLFADAQTHGSEIFVIPDDEKPEVTSGTIIGVGFERESTRNVVDVHVGPDLTLSNNVLNTARVLGGGGYDNFESGTSGLVIDTTLTARIILDVDILLAAGIESGETLGIPTLTQARDRESEIAYIWTPQRVHQAAAATLSRTDGVFGDLIGTLTFRDDLDVDLPGPGGSGTEVTRSLIGGSGSLANWLVPESVQDHVSAYTASSDAYTRLKVPRIRPTQHIGGFIAQSYIRYSIGTISAPGLTVGNTSMILAAVPTTPLAVGDQFRIENEIVEITIVPAASATGIAARTYGVARGQESTGDIAHATGRHVRHTELALYHETDWEWGPGNIYNQGAVATAVSGLKMEAEATVQLRYISEEGADNLYIALFSRDGMVARGSEVRVYWKVESGLSVESSAGQQTETQTGVAELTPDLVLTTLWQVSDTEPAEPPAHWRFDDEWSNSNAGPAPWVYDKATALTHAQLNPAYDAATFSAFIAQELVRRRISNDAYTYTDYGWTVSAEYDVQYRTDAEPTPTATVPDLTRRGVQMRSRLPNGQWTAWGYITTPTNDWILIFGGLTGYTNGSQVSAWVNFPATVDLSAFQEIRLRARHFGDFVNNLPTDFGTQHDTIIHRPAAGWPVSSVTAVGTDANNAAGIYTVRSDEQDGLVMTYQAGGSLDTTLDDDVRRTGGHGVPSRRASWRFKFYGASGSENSVIRLIHFGWPPNSNYNRVQLFMWGR